LGFLLADTMESTKSPKARPKKVDSKPIRLFHKIAVLTVLAGGGGSLGFMLYTGRHNDSVVLKLLFAGWVLSPFIALLLVNAVAQRWSLIKRLTHYSLMLLITVGSLVIYSGVWSPPAAKPAFVFLVVPLISWMLMGIAILIAAFRPSK
jgi:hypothetical protein